MTADGSRVFMRVFFLLRQRLQQQQRRFFVCGRLLSARGSRSVKKGRSPAHWLRFNVFIYSFIYLFSLGFPPSDAHCLLSSLFSPPHTAAQPPVH